jgi:ERCC4-type nuclease
MNRLPKRSSCRIAAVLAGACLLAVPTLFAQSTAASPAAADAAYTKAIEQRTADILSVLGLNDPAKAARVHDAIVEQYRSLNAWQTADEARLKELAGKGQNAAARGELDQIMATRKALHERFLARLAPELTLGQIEQVKDKMTYNKEKVTYDAYCEIIPSLSAEQKAKILEFLKQAREEAMDGVSANEKSAIFKKYKGRIANYLSAQGVDEAKARKEWTQRQHDRPPIE